MFGPDPKTELQTQIDKLLRTLDDQQPNSEEYGTTVDKILKLHKIQEDLKPESISPNTALTVAANLIGIAMIVRHEHLNVITSKALSFVLKPR